MKGLRRFNPNDPRNWNDSSSPSFHNPANPNSPAGRASRERREAEFAHPPETERVADPPLDREPPIGGEPPTARSHYRATAARSRPGEYRGTVLQVVQPRVNEIPWLILDIRTDSGETVVVRGRFFWGALRAPYVAPGHYVRVGGEPTSDGYIKPRYIINQSTGSQWRRSSVWPW